MAKNKKMACNLYLEEKTVYALDEAAETFGLSRSEVANMLLSGTLGADNVEDVVRSMFAAALEEKRKKRTLEEEFQPA